MRLSKTLGNTNTAGWISCLPSSRIPGLTTRSSRPPGRRARSPSSTVDPAPAAAELGALGTYIESPAMMHYQVVLLFSMLQTVVPGLLGLGCWLWWRRTNYWPFLLLALCGALWFASGAAMFIGDNVANFGKTPKQIAHDRPERLLHLLPAIYYFNLALLLLCAVAGAGLLRAAPTRATTQPDVPNA